MATQTYNTTFVLGEKQKLFWGQEKVAAGTVAATFFQEEFGTFSWSPQRTIWVNNLRVGFPSKRLGSQVTVQHAQLTANVPFHPGGLGGYAVACILGDVGNTGTADTITGAGDPYTHTVVPGVNSTRTNTFSLVFHTGETGATPGLQFVYCTIEHVKLSGTSGNPLMAEIVMSCYYPTSVAAPSSTFISPSTYTFGFQSNHTLYNSASGTAYSAKITNADITLSRPVNVLASYNNNGSQNPIDIYPDDLSLQATVDLLYDGMGTGKAYSEYLTYLKAGSATNVNKILFTDANSTPHSVEIDFWPAAWTASNIQETAGSVVSLSATLDAEQDFSTATGGSPTWTLIKQAILKNNQAAAMIT